MVLKVYKFVKFTQGSAKRYFYSLPSERIDIAALRAAMLFLGFISLFLRWEGSNNSLEAKE